MDFFQAQNITKSYGFKTILNDISFGLQQGDKAALIAPNGTGKTTLLNIIAGIDSPDTGNCVFHREAKVSFLLQNPEFKKNITVIDFILSSESPAIKAIRDYEMAVALSQHSEVPYNKGILEHCIHEMDRHNAWNYEAQVKAVLGKLQLNQIEQNIHSLSGGQQKRVALAKTLLDDANFFILDEPTNHLDIDMIEWLEDYLSTQKTTLLLVTHDRYFLDNICNVIFEIDNQKIYRYEGNYSYYLEKKSEREFIQQREQEKNRNLFRKELEWIRRMPKARTTKSKSRIDAFDELKNKINNNTAPVNSEIQIKSPRLGNKIVNIENIAKTFEDKKIINSFSYKFLKNDKIGVVGKNGSGKSTLLNIISGGLASDAGNVDIGETVKIAYFKQDGLQLSADKKTIDVVNDIAEYVVLADGSQLSASQFLSYFNFSYPVQQTLFSKLSGGEKRRLYLLVTLMQNPNVLILDEPTNDLDIFTLQILEDFLIDYQGCVIVATHDRFFINKIAQHVFVFQEEGNIKDFYGNYNDYRMQIAEKPAIKSETKIVKEKPAIKEKQTNKLTYKEQKELERLELEIPQIEATLSDLLSQMSNSEAGDLQTIASAYEEKQKLLEVMNERWLELSMKL